MSDDLDELLQPSVSPTPRQPRARPWRVQSQFWVAFFGGILPLTVVALLNARRLDLEPRKRYMMIGLASLALILLAVLWASQPMSPSFVQFARGKSDLRLAGRVLSVAMYLAFAALQKSADSHYRVFSDGEYTSLWGVGVPTTFLVGTLQSLVLPAIVWLVRS